MMQVKEEDFMQKSRVLILLILVAAVGVAGTTWIAAQQQRRQGSHVLLSPEDYIEIHQLYSFTRAMSIQDQRGMPRGCSPRMASLKWATGVTQVRN